MIFYHLLCRCSAFRINNNWNKNAQTTTTTTTVTVIGSNQTPKYHEMELAFKSTQIRFFQRFQVKCIQKKHCMSVYLILASIPGRFFLLYQCIVQIFQMEFFNCLFGFSTIQFYHYFLLQKKGQNWKKLGFCANLGRNCWNYVRFIIWNAKCQSEFSKATGFLLFSSSFNKMIFCAQ